MRRLAIFFLALGVASCPSGGGSSSSSVPAIMASDSHTCALTSSGSVHCWGWGDSGRLGYGNQIDRSRPGEPIPGLSGVIQIAPGQLHSCALVAGGSVHCWGDGTNGKLGYGNNSVRLSPGEAIPGLRDVTQLESGAYHVCALVSGGRVHCWGWGDAGRLGYGNDSDRNTPAEIIPGLSNVEQIAAGTSHTCVLVSNGSVFCWGAGGRGRLGYGDEASRSESLEPVPGLANVTQISAGNGHTCALISNGNVHCWGDGGSGELGYRNRSNRLSPGEVVPGLSGVRQISAGGSHTCALIEGGSVDCWGTGSQGQLGYGSTSSSNRSGGAIPGLSGVRQISTGSAHSCALVESGNVHCWGRGFSNRLGYGNRSNRLAPGEPIPSFSLFR